MSRERRKMTNLDQKRNDWEDLRKSYGIAEVIEQSPNGEFHVNVDTSIRASSGAKIRTERHGSYVVYNVSGSQYVILETRRPDGRGKLRHLFTDLSPEEILRKEGHL